MDIELLYLYIGENNTSVTNIDICFSHEYNIKYYEKSLIIEKMNTYPYKGFYGNYIKSCSLIVGKNGSGKTTLLNFLGLCSRNLSKYYYLGTPKENNLKNFIIKNEDNYNNYGCWFALYSVNDLFYIEGFNFEKLFELKNINNERIKRNFSIFIDYDFQSKKMNPMKLADHYLTTYVDFFYYKKTTETISTYFDNPNDDITNSRDYPGHDEHTIRLNRREIKDANINNIYRLFGNYKELLIDNDFGKKSKIIIEITRHDRDDLLSFDRVIKSEFHFFNNLETNSFKEMFISNMYYSLAYGLWNEYFRLDKGNDENIIKNNNADFIFNESTYKDIASYYLEDINSTRKFNPLPNYIDILDGYAHILEEIDEKYFLNQYSIEIPLIQHDELIQNLLDYHFELSNLDLLEQLFNVKYTKLSSGEHEYIEVFGSIIKILSEIQANSECKNRILLLDEPDRTFHPEWASNYIYKLTKILNYFGEKTGISFQVIITTHSPFMVSDVLKEDIYKIENKNGLKRIIHSEYGFASNYYDIITDIFFLASSVGEFAKRKIDEINNKIQKSTSLNELTHLKKYIDVIGDRYLKNILTANYHKKLEEMNSNDKDEIKNRISELKEELKILEGKYNE